jgi:hypothetical protein
MAYSVTFIEGMLQVSAATGDTAVGQSRTGVSDRPSCVLAAPRVGGDTQIRWEAV